MKRIHYFLACITIGLFCTGCWPLRLTTSPGASGVVVDARTHAAISGAQVVVCRSDFLPAQSSPVADTLKNARPPQVVTRANGRFSIRREHRWIIYFPSPMMAPATGQLVVRREGYETVMLPLIADPKGAGGSSEFLAGDITNLASFAAKLKTPSDPVSAWLIEKFSDNARTAVAQYPESGMDRRLLQSILVKELDAVITGPVIYEKNRFRGVTLSPQALGMMEHLDRLYSQAYPGAAFPLVRAEFNRKLLEDAYPGDFSGKRGSGYYQSVGVVLLTPIAK
jgi:hypothetical protein